MIDTELYEIIRESKKALEEAPVLGYTAADVRALEKIIKDARNDLIELKRQQKNYGSFLH